MPIYLLTLRGPLHIGEAVGIEREAVMDWLPSDSLWSALVSAWQATGADVNARVEAFQANAPPFRLTSAFPWSGGIRFYPAPILNSAHCGLEGKDAKRVRWLSERVFEQLQRGAKPDPSAENRLHGGAVWLTAEERASAASKFTGDDGAIRLWSKFVVPRVTVDRASNASNLFHAGRVSFPADGGLWFAAHGPQTDWIDAALAYLADAGLGGLRNYGHGAFTVERREEDLAVVEAGAGLTLARYAPAGESELRATLPKPGAAYRFVTVGGWCKDDAGKAWRRRSVRMLTEGAIIPEAAEARGALVDVRPQAVPAFTQRAVYRYGLPFFVPAGKFLVEEGSA